MYQSVDAKKSGYRPPDFSDSDIRSMEAGQVFLYCLLPDLLTVGPPLGVPVLTERRSTLRAVPADPGVHRGMAYPARRAASRIRIRPARHSCVRYSFSAASISIRFPILAPLAFTFFLSAL